MSKRGERLWTLSLTLLFLFFTSLLVHGVLYRKPSHLLPYFSVQVFDFVLSCLTVMGYMTYMPYIKNHDSSTNEMGMSSDNHQSLFPTSSGEGQSGPLHYRNWDRVNAGTRLAIMTLAFLMLALKAYFMGMVWACYKYLIMWHRIQANNGALQIPTNMREALQDMWDQMRRPIVFTWLLTSARQNSASTTRNQDLESQSLLPGAAGEDETITYPSEGDAEAVPVEPPNYEDLLKQPANANMPPPYFKEGNGSHGNESKK